MSNDTTSIIERVLTAFFTESPAEELSRLLSDDFYGCGLANDEVVEGKAQALDYAARTALSLGSPCRCIVHESKELSASAVVIRFTLVRGDRQLGYRATGMTKPVDGENRLCLLQVSPITVLNKPSRFEALASMQINSSKQRLLDETVAGGMMGGYIEDGFPFYFINHRMLSYLGYSSEQEFVRDIDGLINNCMHPEDVAFVNCETMRQLDRSGEYQVEYRMRKKDGSYIWVHDIGRKATAEDDREVIISVCYDITAEKEHTELLDSLVNNINGGMALYRAEEDWRMTLLFASEGVGAVSGRGREEYKELCREDAMRGVYREDRKYALDVIRQVVSDGKPQSLDFRVLDKDDNCLWIHALYSRCGEDHGRPVVRAIFLPASLQYDLQLEALNTEASGVYVVDRETDELYYANDACFELHGIPKANITGKTCHEAFAGNCERCPDCWMNDSIGRGPHESIRKNRQGRTHSFTVQEKTWNGRNVMVVYFHDITERELLQAELHRNQLITEAACAFANMWIFTLDTQSRTIYSGERFCREFNFPEALPGFPQSVLKFGLILPEYESTFTSAFESLYSGAPVVEFDIETRYPGGGAHWIHYRGQLLDKSIGGGHIAAVSAQEVDGEKAREARLELERKRIQAEDNRLLYYFIANVNTDEIVEHKSLTGDEYHVKNGMSLAELLRESSFRLRFDADRSVYHALHDPAALTAMYQSGETQKEMEYQMSIPGSKLVWVRFVLHLLPEPNTNNILLYEYLYRIDTDKMVEELLHIVLDSSFEACGVLNTGDNQYTLLEVDPDSGKPRSSDVKYNEVVASYVENLVHPEDRELYLKRCGRDEVLKAAKNHDEFRYRTLEDGKVHYKRCCAYLRDEDRGICLLTRSDITDLVLTEEREKKLLSDALEQARNASEARAALSQDRERLYAALFSIVPMVISSNVTQNYYTMLNYDSYTTKKAAVSGTYDELIAVGVTTVPDDQKEIFYTTFSRENVLRAYENGQKDVILEHQQMGDDGVMRWIETRVVFVPSSINGDLCTITLAQDISERRMQQARLTEALDAAEAATRAKSEFLSRMSHEIRTPMNAIMGMTAIAKENRSNFQQVAECLDKIDMSSHYLLTLINDILEMSRIESGKTEIKNSEFNFDFLIESIRTVIEPLALKGDVRYEFLNNAKTETYYRGDMMRIQQVMVNLLTNAVKFTRPGGRVRFGLNVDSQTDSQTVFRFSVADTGIGMSEEFMKKMFRPFVQEDGSNTSRYAGSGLGLAISKSLVEAMGGTIQVESFRGVGSTFTVRLPLERVKYAQIKAPESDEKPLEADLTVLNGARILMAEDHHLNVMVARKLLERKGVQVTVADNGQIAVELFRNSQPGYYSAVLMDIRMPVMDGLNAARAIRALNRPDAATIPIIAMTANALDEDRRNSREAGMDAHLAKPFEPAQLYSVLAQYITEAKKHEQR